MSYIMIGTVLAGVLGLVGIAVGAWLTSRSQAKAWLKGMRLEAYLEFITAAREFLWRGAEVGRDQSTLEADREAVRLAMLDIRYGWSKLHILGPDSLMPAVDQLHDYYTETLYDVFRTLDSRHAEPPPDPIGRGRTLLSDFQNAASHALGVYAKK